MPTLATILDPEQLLACIEAGLVRARQHPTLPLTIYNYAEMAVYTRQWNEVTLTCRGLVGDSDGVVVARPWAKFFNHGEHQEGALDLDAPVEVTDKADGSLGILIADPAWGEPFLATRGSFVSEQAFHATDVYRARYASAWTPKLSLTYLFEIVYPENRIVLDYSELDDLLLLGAVDRETGTTYGPSQIGEWPGPRVATFEYRTLRDALTAEPRTNAEGFVVRFPETDLLVKIKQQDYLELHRLVTGLNARVVWQSLAEDPNGLAPLLERLPDEFQQWALDLAQGLNEQAAAMAAAAQAEHGRILAALPDGWGRRDYAEVATRSELRGLLFLLLDGRSPRDHIWKALRPSGDVVPRSFGEDTA